MKTFRFFICSLFCVAVAFIVINKTVSANESLINQPTGNQTKVLMAATPTPKTGEVTVIPAKEKGTILFTPNEPINLGNVDKITQIGRFLKSPIVAIRFVPQHNLMVIGTVGGVYFYDSNTYEEKGYYYFRNLNTIDISPNGNLLAIGSGLFDNKVVILSIPNLNEIKEIQLRNSNNGKVVTSAASASFSPDSTLLAVSDQKTIVYYLDSWSTFVKLEAKNQTDEYSVFSPDGAYLATYGLNNLNLWKMPEGKLIATISDQRGITTAEFSPDSEILAVGTISKAIRIINPKDGKIIQSLLRHSNSIKSIKFSSDNKYLLVGSNDKTASLWTVSNWTSIHTFRHLSPVDAVSFTPDNKMVITASSVDKDQGSNLLFWDISNFTLKQKITGFLASTYPSTPTWAIDISQDNLHLASVSEDNFARIWNLVDGSLVAQIPVKNTRSIVFSPDGTTVAVGNEFFSFPEGKLKLKLPFQVGKGVFSKDGTVYAAIGPYGVHSIYIWNTVENRLVSTIPSDGRHIAISNNGDMVAVDGSGTGRCKPCVKVFDINTKKKLYQFKSTSDPQDLKFDSKDKSIFLGDWTDSSVRKTLDGQFLTTFEEDLINGQSISCGYIAISPGEEILFNGPTIDRISDGWKIGSLPIFIKSPEDVEFSSDGRFVATSTYSGEVLIWGIKNEPKIG